MKEDYEGYYFPEKFSSDKNERLWDAWGFAKVRLSYQTIFEVSYKVVGVTIDGFLVLSSPREFDKSLDNIPEDWYVKKACRNSDMTYIECPDSIIRLK